MAQIDFAGMYMVPSKVYVGDRARLILPLPAFPDTKAEINHGHILSSPDIDIHHIVLERRPGGSFLTIEFSAYTTGILELPPIDIAGETFSGLTIEINSILSPDESGTVLSPPVLPLAIPGTSLLIYGSISTAILLMLLTVWALVWGRKRLQGWLSAWKRKRLLASMLGTERRLHKALLKGVDCRQILDILSTEFRSFLTSFTGTHYRAMTAAEISLLKDTEGKNDVLDDEFLGGFFSHCDGIRFSGREIDNGETLAILGDLKHFLAGITA